MSGILRVQWTRTPRAAPRPRLNCSRCGDVRSFASSGKIRLNANGRRIDAWLIYKCADCENTWNRPLLERRNVGEIDPATLRALETNDSAFVQKAAFDLDDLKRRAVRIDESAAVFVDKSILSAPEPPFERLEIRLVVRAAILLRVDRLLANEFGCARARIQALSDGGRLTLHPHGARMLRRPVRDGMVIRADACDSMAWANMACGYPSGEA